MARLRFEELAAGVLQEVVAALPLQQVLRLQRLQHALLRRCCGAAQVAERATGVTFELLVKARLEGADTAAIFFTPMFLKKLYGKVVINIEAIDNTDYLDVCVELANRVPGSLHLYTKQDRHQNVDRLDDNLMTFLQRLKSPCSLRYITHLYYMIRLPMIKLFPNLVYVYIHRERWEGGIREIYCRQELLNGRSALDVVEAVSERLVGLYIRPYDPYESNMRKSYEIRKLSNGLLLYTSNHSLPIEIP